MVESRSVVASSLLFSATCVLQYACHQLSSETCMDQASQRRMSKAAYWQTFPVLWSGHWTSCLTLAAVLSSGPRFVPDLGLHVWTRRWALMAFAHNGAFLLLSAAECSGRLALATACWVLLAASFVACVLMNFRLMVLKLEALGQLRQALLCRILSAPCICLGLLGVPYLLLLQAMDVEVSGAAALPGLLPVLDFAAMHAVVVWSTVAAASKALPQQAAESEFRAAQGLGVGLRHRSVHGRLRRSHVEHRRPLPLRAGAEGSRRVYLRVVERRRPEESAQQYEERLAFHRADAEAMGLRLLVEAACPAIFWWARQAWALRQCRALRRRNGCRAPWGCERFRRWKENVEQALRQGQKFIVFYSGPWPGAGLRGRLPWAQLRDAAALRGARRQSSLGASQRVEVAYLESRGIPYEAWELGRFQELFVEASDPGSFWGQRMAAMRRTAHGLPWRYGEATLPEAMSPVREEVDPGQDGSSQCTACTEWKCCM